jgi:hypothetical protein
VISNNKIRKILKLNRGKNKSKMKVNQLVKNLKQQASCNKSVPFKQIKNNQTTRVI